jgi:tRNA-splicing ligase RtcB
MNARQLEKLGIPKHCANTAIGAIQQLVSQKTSRRVIRDRLTQVAENPALFIGDLVLNSLAKAMQDVQEVVSHEPISYQRWRSNIDGGALKQMEDACSIPGAVAAAVMPDAHLGYGLPIGGVLALDNAVVPYAVGVEIACRMKLSLLDMPVASIDKQFDRYRNALENGTRFGVGVEHENPQGHAVLDADWKITRITRQNKNKARRQLGTSGSGNHFVEFGIVTLSELKFPGNSNRIELVTLETTGRGLHL